MYAIKAVYDGTNFRLKQPIPVKENYEVIITFVEPVAKEQSSILDFFNCWNGEDLLDLEDVKENRKNFFDGRLFDDDIS